MQMRHPDTRAVIDVPEGAVAVYRKAGWLPADELHKGGVVAGAALVVVEAGEEFKPLADQPEKPKRRTRQTTQQPDQEN